MSDDDSPTLPATALIGRGPIDGHLATPDASYRGSFKVAPPPPLVVAERSDGYFLCLVCGSPLEDRTALVLHSRWHLSTGTYRVVTDPDELARFLPQDPDSLEV